MGNFGGDANLWIYKFNCVRLSIKKSLEIQLNQNKTVLRKEQNNLNDTKDEQENSGLIFESFDR